MTATTLDLGDRTVALEVRRSARAKRIGLRVDRGTGAVRVTVPRGRSDADGVRFARDNAAWLQRQIARVPARVAFEPGAVVPVLGHDHVIRHDPDGRFGVRREDGCIRVAGAVEHVPRRVTDHLKREARTALRPHVDAFAAAIGAAPGRVRVRDTRSRWGSCSPRGDIMVCWRIVLAPESVVAYLAAHEVAHLRHRDHSPAFWGLVRELMPAADAQRRWLREHGPGLFAYG